jgi:hypothetical protein
MKQFFARLNPMERRFVVGVGVAFFVVLNAVFVLPHYADWGETRKRMDNAQIELDKFERGTNDVPGLKQDISKYRSEGDVVPQEDQAVNFFRLIQNQATASGVGIINMGSTRQSGATNQFFVEQNQTISTLSGEKQLVDFLYNLGAGKSLIRVKVLSVQPDAPHQQLSARITLIASYQKKPTTGKAAAATTALAPKAAPTPQKVLPPAPAKPPSPVPPSANPKPNPVLPKPPIPGQKNLSVTNSRKALTPIKQ